MDKLISGSDTHKMLSLLLENYKNIATSIKKGDKKMSRVRAWLDKRIEKFILHVIS